MKNKNITLLAAFTIGIAMAPLTHASVNTIPSFEKTIQDGKSVSFVVKVTYLGNPVDGASVSVMKEGKTLAQSTSDAKGNASIKVDDYKGGATDLQITKEGYKTQVLTGFILKDGNDYKFALVRGTGTITTAIASNLDKIVEKSTNEIRKQAEKEEKARNATEEANENTKSSQENATEYAEQTKEEKEKREVAKAEAAEKRAASKETT